MPKGSFEYKDFLKLWQNMLEAEKQIDPWLEDFLIEQGVKALNLAKPRTPVDTGLLQKSWQFSSVTRKGNTLMLDLFNEVEYASYMEHGFTYFTSKGEMRYPGHHMAEISVKEVMDALPAEMQGAFLKWLSKFGWEG